MKISPHIIVFVTIALLISTTTHATNSQPLTKGQQINVGVYLLDIGKFDLSTGGYTADFYLSLTSDQPIQLNSFEFMNGRASSLDLLVNEPTNRIYRVQASLHEKINLRAYPFDTHAVTIQVEEKDNGISNVIYRTNFSKTGIDRNVTIVGWDLVGWTSQVIEHAYPVFDDTYSRYVFSVRIHRNKLSAILKAFLPVTFLIFVGMLSLLFKPEKFESRLALTTSTLLGAVMFHVNLGGQIPPVGYLTFADRFMIISYIVLIACLSSAILLMRHIHNKNDILAQRIYRWSLTGIPILTIGLYVLVFLTRNQ